MTLQPRLACAVLSCGTVGGCFFIVILDNWTALGINQSGVPNDDMAYVTVMSEREAMMRLVCTHYVHVQKC